MNRQERWDRDYLALAQFWAERKSKDPSTQVGAVIVSSRNKVVGMGYNGFPVGVEDRPERYNVREEKYKFVVHAEPNAIRGVDPRDLEGATIYTWPFPTCHECAKLIIQFGIKRVVAPTLPDELRERWDKALDTGAIMYEEAGVKLELMDVRADDATPSGEGAEDAGRGGSGEPGVSGNA